MRGGALKQTPNNFFVHIACAIAMNECTFQSALRRRRVLVDTVPRSRFELVFQPFSAVIFSLSQCKLKRILLLYLGV